MGRSSRCVRAGELAVFALQTALRSIHYQERAFRQASWGNLITEIHVPGVSIRLKDVVVAVEAV